MAPRVAPIRFCSRRGLPCRRRCRPRGALLPHPFTLALRLMALQPAIRRFAFCGAFPGVAPAGRYPAPYPYGARTFLRFRGGGRPADWLRGHMGRERRRSSGIGLGRRDGTGFPGPAGVEPTLAPFIEASRKLWECARWGRRLPPRPRSGLRASRRDESESWAPGGKTGDFRHEKNSGSFHRARRGRFRLGL